MIPTLNADGAVTVNPAPFIEFQAIVMAVGLGSRVYPLCTGRHGTTAAAISANMQLDTIHGTGNSTSKSTLLKNTQTQQETSGGMPKALLPIVNRPILAFPLDLLERSGFKEAIVVCREAQQHAITRYIHEVYSEKSTLHVSIVGVDNNIEGTADALRSIESLIKTDYFVLPTDLISNVHLQYMADVQRRCDSAVTVLVAPPKEASKDRHSGKKAHDDDDLDIYYMAVDAKQKSRMLAFTPAADIEETFDISKSLLRRHPSLHIHNSLRDVHVYLFAHWTLQLLDEKQSIQSIQADLVPYLVRSQYRRNLRKYRAFSKSMQQEMAFSMTHSPHDARGTLLDDENYRCHCFVAPTNALCQRAATSLQAYISTNFELSADPIYAFTPWKPLLVDNCVEEVVRLCPQAKIAPMCVIGRDTTIKEKSVLKRCIIGRNVKIGADCKLQNVVIMDYCTIENGVSITDSVLGPSCSIGAGSMLKDCKLAENFVVAPSAEFKNELLVNEES